MLKMFFSGGWRLLSVALVLLAGGLLQTSHSIKWITLRAGVPPAGQGRCALARALGVAPCAALTPLALAARLARDSCRQLCAHRRWNCSSLDLAPDYSPDLLLGTKEQSFVYALSAAALMHTMARACSSGLLSSCTCGQPPRQRPGRGFKWGGCSDNLKWAGRFVKQFTENPDSQDFFEKTDKDQKEIQIYDTADRRIDKNGNVIEKLNETVIILKIHNGNNKSSNVEQTPDSSSAREPPRAAPEEKHTVVQEHLNTDNLGGDENIVGGLANVATLVKREVNRRKKVRYRGAKRQRMAHSTRETLGEKLERLQPYITLANLQNSKVGRKLAERSLRVECKCHGVSGSCSVRTCWRALPPLGVLGAALLARTAGAARVRPPRPPRHYALSRADGRRALLYVSPSPDYCRRDPATGSLGTAGRWCNGSLSHGESSCRSLCCGRGHRTQESSRLERCHCRYIWCCRVECQLCKITSENHYCN